MRGGWVSGQPCGFHEGEVISPKLTWTDAIAHGMARCDVDLSLAPVAYHQRFNYVPLWYGDIIFSRYVDSGGVVIEDRY